MTSTATATAHPNIALVKYWGKRDLPRNLPAVPSISMTLDRFRTTTTVHWGTAREEVVLDGQPASDAATARVRAFLDRIAADRPPVRVESASNFPVAAGLASSSSAFAALALAATTAAGRPLPPAALSALARQGSGSACRSLWGGFVEWTLGERGDGADSHGHPLAPPDHWDLAMVVGVVSDRPKAVGSTAGMERSRRTSPYYAPWVDLGPGLVAEARSAILDRDLARLGAAMEASTFAMHATMHTARPPLLYWAPATVACLHAVAALRAQGVGAWATMDAGPNVKVLCPRAEAPTVQAALAVHVERVEVLGPGPGPTLEEAP